VVSPSSIRPTLSSLVPPGETGISSVGGSAIVGGALSAASLWDWDSVIVVYLLCPVPHPECVGAAAPEPWRVAASQSSVRRRRPARQNTVAVCRHLSHLLYR
jgi:hypothetical protein